MEAFLRRRLGLDTFFFFTDPDTLAALSEPTDGAFGVRALLRRARRFVRRFFDVLRFLERDRETLTLALVDFAVDGAFGVWAFLRRARRFLELRLRERDFDEPRLFERDRETLALVDFAVDGAFGVRAFLRRARRRVRRFLELLRLRDRERDALVDFAVDALADLAVDGAFGVRALLRRARRFLEERLLVLVDLDRERLDRRRRERDREADGDFTLVDATEETADASEAIVATEGARGTDAFLARRRRLRRGARLRDLLALRRRLLRLREEAAADDAADGAFGVAARLRRDRVRDRDALLRRRFGCFTFFMLAEGDADAALFFSAALRSA